MFGLNQLDSARYYFQKGKEDDDIYEKAVRYDGLYQVEKKIENWKAAVENVDAYLILYDSIQGLSDSQKLARLMDNYQFIIANKNNYRKRDYNILFPSNYRRIYFSME